MVDASYGAEAGPYLYSAPSEQTVHVVVDLPPTGRSETIAGEAPTPVPQAPVTEVAPLDETLLVFRDGHQRSVTNYAIMGDTLYIFGKRMQKVDLGDLDLPATIKLNDKNGVDFHLPKSPQG